MTQVHKDIHYAQTKSVKRLRAPLLSQKGKRTQHASEWKILSAEDE